MNLKMVTAAIFFVCIFSSISAHRANAATCPASDRYALLNYDHNLLNQEGEFSLASRVLGFVGIQIGPSGIVNSGNNVLQRMVEMEVESVCSSKGESDVTVTITGECVQGVLNMRIQEIYPEIILSGSCGTGPPVEASNTDFQLEMEYINNTTKTAPYVGAAGSGTYSWQLQFTDEPPPAEALPLAPILHLLQKKVR